VSWPPGQKPLNDQIPRFQKRQLESNVPVQQKSARPPQLEDQSLETGSPTPYSQPPDFRCRNGGFEANCDPYPPPRPIGNTRCDKVRTGPNSYQFKCQILDPRAVTLKYEHILWLGGQGGAPAVEIIVPNYRVEEIIKAGFKADPTGTIKQPIKILLQRPEKEVVASIDQSPQTLAPEVNIQYESIPRPTIVHYPTDQQYRTLSGPLLPPPPRNQRFARHQY